ncbi:UNVERIFIED_CONTAM: hypothetical protein K2H54_013752 [Gekko kuhli]
MRHISRAKVHPVFLEEMGPLVNQDRKVNEDRKEIRDSQLILALSTFEEVIGIGRGVRRRGQSVTQVADRDDRLAEALALNGRIVIAGDKLFATTGKTVDFDNTVKICRAAHGAIAAPVNKMENEAIMSLVQDSNTYAYLGMTEGPVPGEFHFLNGAPVNYTNWYEGEPKGKGAERCVEMYLDGTWNDKICDKYRLSVCEFTTTPVRRP